MSEHPAPYRVTRPAVISPPPRLIPRRGQSALIARSDVANVLSAETMRSDLTLAERDLLDRLAVALGCDGR